MERFCLSARETVMAWLNYLWQRLGRAGRVGIFLLAGSALLWAAMIWPAQSKLAKLAAEVATKSAAARSQEPVAPKKLADFRRYFPSLDSLPDQLSLLDSAASDSDLEVRDAQYQLQPVPGLGVMRYQINLPVVGDYPGLRGFLAKVLSEVPNAVLDETSFERDGKSDFVSAHLRFSFYYQAVEAKR
jgi:hypothetical protein